MGNYSYFFVDLLMQLITTLPISNIHNTEVKIELEYLVLIFMSRYARAIMNDKFDILLTCQLEIHAEHQNFVHLILAFDKHQHG